MQATPSSLSQRATPGAWRPVTGRFRPLSRNSNRPCLAPSYDLMVKSPVRKGAAYRGLVGAALAPISVAVGLNACGAPSCAGSAKRLSGRAHRRSWAGEVRRCVRALLALALVIAVLAGCSPAPTAPHRPAKSPQTYPSLRPYGRGGIIVKTRRGKGPVFDLITFLAPSDAYLVVFWCLGPGRPILSSDGQHVPFTACTGRGIDSGNFDSTRGSVVKVGLAVHDSTVWEMLITRYPTAPESP